jgi:hypothetical protein
MAETAAGDWAAVDVLELISRWRDDELVIAAAWTAAHATTMPDVTAEALRQIPVCSQADALHVAGLVNVNDRWETLHAGSPQPCDGTLLHATAQAAILTRLAGGVVAGASRARRLLLEADALIRISRRNPAAAHVIRTVTGGEEPAAR